MAGLKPAYRDAASGGHDSKLRPQRIPGQQQNIAGDRESGMDRDHHRRHALPAHKNRNPRHQRRAEQPGRRRAEGPDTRCDTTCGSAQDQQQNAKADCPDNSVQHSHDGRRSGCAAVSRAQMPQGQTGSDRDGYRQQCDGEEQYRHATTPRPRRLSISSALYPASDNTAALC